MSEDPITDYLEAIATPRPQPPEFFDVMIDIETASASTHNAVVLSAAWIPFAIQRTEPVPIMGDKYLVVPSIREQLALGREVDPATMKWWAKESEDAREHWVKPGGKVVPIATLLDSLRVTARGKRIWAHGCCFDIGNLESLYQSAGQSTPWAYNDVRDARTLYRLFQPDQTIDMPRDLTAHDPVADCIKQIWELRRRWPAEPAE